MRQRQQEATSRGIIENKAPELRDPDPARRLEAVKELAKSQDKQAVEYLIEATADEDPRVKLKAIDELGILRASDATPALVQTLYLKSSEPWLRQRILVTLGKIGDNRAVQPIGDLLVRETNPETVGTALFALGEIGDPKAVPDLQKVAEQGQDDRVRRLAQDAIGKIQLKQVNPEVKVKALQRALGGDETQRPASASAAPPIGY